MQPDASKIDQLLSSVPFFNSLEALDALKAELPTYLAKAVGTEGNFSPLEWWEMNTFSLPQGLLLPERLALSSLHLLHQSIFFALKELLMNSKKAVFKTILNA